MVYRIELSADCFSVSGLAYEFVVHNGRLSLVDGLFSKSGANICRFGGVLLVKTTKRAYGGAFFAKILRIRSSERSKSCAKAA